MRILVWLLWLVVMGCGSKLQPIEIMPLEDQRAPVSETLRVELRALGASTDARWSFSAPTIEDLSSHARWATAGAAATFQWAPLATHLGDHQLTFTVESKGRTDSKTINVRVIRVAPQFIQPAAGDAFEFEETPCLSVDIEIIDSDSTSVEIRQREPIIVGAQLERQDGFRAQWSWCPTPQQVEASLRYSLRLEADDGDHEPVPHIYDIVLIPRVKEDCPGRPPVVTPMGPTQGQPLATVQDYEVQALVTDDQGLKDQPLLYFSLQRPDEASPNLPEMNMVPFELVENNLYRALIPNLVLVPGEEQTLYYLVAAVDDDDPHGTLCDHQALSPLRSLVVAEPSQPDLRGYCEPCSQDRQCHQGLCVAGESSFCGVDCLGPCPGGTCQAVISRDGVADEQCVPDDSQCGQVLEVCIDDALEDANDALWAPPLMELGTSVTGQVCSDDADFYAFAFQAEQMYRIEASGWNPAVTDIDLALFSPDLDVVETLNGTSGSEQTEFCAAVSDTYVVGVVGYRETDQGPYELRVDVLPDGSCCVDDGHEDNDALAQARAMVCDELVEGRICPLDDDWLSVEVSAPSRFEIVMDCSEGGGDLDLQLYDADAGLVDFSLRSDCDESIDVDLAAGSYYLRVSGYGGARGHYELFCALNPLTDR
jgi:hypothetical protein